MRAFGPSIHSDGSWKEKIYFGSLMSSFSCTELCQMRHKKKNNLGFLYKEKERKKTSSKADMVTILEVT